MSNLSMSIEIVDGFIFDFDGVLTDNLVYVREDGNESVCCTRSDGLGFDVLRQLQMPAYILSSEDNTVVAARGHKLRVEVVQGVSNKRTGLLELSKSNELDLDRMVYVGNDLNDVPAMKLCKYRVCPADAHPRVKAMANIILKVNGGHGVVRELLEEVFKLDILEILYS